MTMSTADAEGRPHGRTLILEDVNRLGWAFARHAVPGQGPSARPAAALGFWWPARVRAVRVRGPVVQDLWRIRPRISSLAAAAREGVAEGDWARWRVVPEQIEFWQGAADHRRVTRRARRVLETYFCC